MKSLISQSVTEASERNYLSESNLKLSSMELNEMIADIGETKRKLGRLSKSIIEFETDSTELNYEEEKCPLSSRTVHTVECEDDFE